MNNASIHVCSIITYCSNDKFWLFLSPLRQKSRGEQEKEEVRQGVTQQKYPLLKNKLRLLV